MRTEFDLIVVGAGPSGLSLCRALADSGLDIAVIDPHSAEELSNPPFDGREIALTHPSKHILENLGIWQGFAEDEIYFLREAKVVNGDSPYQLHFALPPTDSKKRPIDTLGYLVSNHNIRRAAYAAAQKQHNLHWFLQEKVVHSTSDAQRASVTLSNGTQLHAPLLVAADSRLSSVRRQMGIVCDMHDFGRTVLVFRLEHSISNDHTAFECFFYGSTLALLPLTDHITNCVITIDSHKVHTLTSLAPQALADHVAAQVQHRFGEMRLISEVCDYPLMGTHARRFHATRCALIGDAACGMHPVTAHGYNLGLQSQEILARLILRQHGQGKDIGADNMLAAYTRQHQRNTLPLYHGTNLIVKLFTRETPIAKVVRGGVLRVSNKLPFLKTIITRQLTG